MIKKIKVATNDKKMRCRTVCTHLHVNYEQIPKHHCEMPTPNHEHSIMRLVTFETLITILTIENLNRSQSLLPDN